MWKLCLFLVIWITFSGVTFAQPSAPYRIMPLGDSITQGDICHDSYRRALWQMLQMAYIPVDFVGSLQEHYTPRCTAYTDYDMDHEGHAGWRADEILANINTWATAAQPDIVLIHLGTNDLMQYQTIESTRDEIGQIIDALRVINPNVIVLLAKIIPHDIPPEFGVPKVDTLNALLPALAAAKNTAQSPVYLVDMFTGFNINTNLQPDRIHASTNGEYFMALRWFNVLKQILMTSSGKYELVTNGGFETLTKAWTLAKLTNDAVICNTDTRTYAYEGTCAFRFTGSSTEASALTQNVTIMPGTIFPGDAMTLSFRARTATQAVASIQVIVYYIDNTQGKMTVALQPGRGYAYSYISPTLTLANTPAKVRVRINNRSLKGNVIIDNLSLTTAPVIGGRWLPLPR